ncbi:MAG: SpoIIE family protein phosphatase [Bdellovibrionota bacterium]
MEQQQFRVSFSVGTKLLISVVLLLFIVIIFLNTSTIVLLKDDKRAYTYKAQSTEAVLAGREFVNLAKHALDTLRISLVTVDPRKPPTPSQGAALQSVIENQSELLGSSVSLLDLDTGAITPLAEGMKQKDLAELGLKASDIQIAPDWMKSTAGELLRNSFAFMNLSKPGATPVVALIVADLNLQSNPAGLPVAIGYIPLKTYANDLKGMNLSIATRSGWVLYDTDAETLFSKKSLLDDPLFKFSETSQPTNGATEYDLESGHFLGSYLRPGLDLIVLSRTQWSKAMRATYALTEKFVLLGFMAIGAAIVFAIFFAKSLVAPLQSLYEATREVAAGNFDLNLDAKSKDEIGALSGSFNVMSHKIAELIQESVAKTHLENELAIASTVQQTLIPPPHYSTDKILIKSHYQAAGSCGGDWWGFFGVDKKLAFMIADATGHGFPSALMTASARSCFSVMAKLAQEDPEFTFSPAAMLSYANRVIFDGSMGKIMMTFFVGVMDFEKMEIRYSSAGHNPPWLFKNDGSGYKLNSLTAVGQRLGEARDVPEFEEKSLPLGPKDILFLYTDGLTEGKDQAGEMYGKKRVRKMVEASLTGGPEKVINNLVADFMKHNNGKPLDDDVTIATALVL